MVLDAERSGVIGGGASAVRAWLLLVATVLVVLLVAAGVASAAQLHKFSSSFAGPGAGADELGLVATGLSEPLGAESAGSGVAVDDASGDVYVADTGNDRVDEFEAGGKFVRAWGWGVEDGKSELESCTSPCRAGLAGTGPGELKAPAFIAVDNAPGGEGDVYVAGPGENLESPENLVTKFTAEGALVKSWGVDGQLDGSSAPEGPFGQLAGVTVDGAGDLWVYVGGTLVAGRNHMYEFEQGDTYKQSCEAPYGGYSPEGIAVDISGDLYVSEGAGSVDEFKPPSCAGGGAVTRFSTSGLAIDPAEDGLYVGDGGSSILDVPTGVSFGAPELKEAAGFAVTSSGVIYAANAGPGEISVFAVSLEANTQPAGAEAAASAVLHGEVNPEGTKISKCVFQYGPTTAYGDSVPCEPAEPGGTGSTGVAVAREVTGLTGGTTYHYRLRVVNANGEELHSEDREFTTLATAVVEEATTIEVEPTTATLIAKVNPEGVAGGTTCEVEYGTSPAPGSGAIIPCAPLQLGSGSAGVAVTAHLGELTSEKTYYWRLLLKDKNGTPEEPERSFVYIPLARPPLEIEEASCPNQPLRGESNPDPRTGLALSQDLPDCRAYELVTPPGKNGALLTRIFFALPQVIASDGSRVIASALQCFAGAQSCTGERSNIGEPFEFSRGEHGWVTRPLGPPAASYKNIAVWGYNADTGTVLYSAPPEGQTSDEFYAGEPDGSLQPIGPLTETLSFEGVGLTVEVFATSDLSHVVFADSNELWPSLTRDPEPLFEYTGREHSNPTLVNVNSNGEVIGSCGVRLGSAESAANADALSAEGSIVYFTACAAELYARVEGARTVLISGHAPENGNGPDECGGVCASSIAEPAFFEGVSEDGSRVFFTSTQQLTNSASEDTTSGNTAHGNGCAYTLGANGCNLYLFEGAGEVPLSGGNLVDVSAGDSSGLGPEVQGVMAVSADGSHVYFVAKGVLAGANGEGRAPVEGADNLYVYERDAESPGGRTVFVATLPGESEEVEEWSTRKAADVSGDGGFLVFTSDGALTGEGSGGVGAAQVFRYDAEDESLLRVSVGEHGYNDDGNAGAGGAAIVAPAAQHVGEPRRDPSMSDDGSLVFFESPVGLTRGALNDVAVSGGGGGLAENVYEWEVDGRGACVQPAGCVYLISDGLDASEVEHVSSVKLLGASASGSDVFFMTADRLVGADTDTAVDYYDARVDGGFPAPREEAQCQGEGLVGEGCHPVTSVPEVFGPLSSGVFSGGNPIGGGKGASKAKTAAEVRAEELTRALKACRKDRRAKKRVVCERAARKRYGPVGKAKRSGKARKSGRSKRVVRGRGGSRGVGGRG